MRRNLIIIFFAVSFHGCMSIQYQDVSLTEEYGKHVGEKYINLIELTFNGIVGSDNINDSILITTPPGLSGPEIGEKSTLPAGEMLQIIRIEKCTNCFYRELRIVVNLTNICRFDNELLEISLLHSRVFSLNLNEEIVINSRILQKVE